jgi:hypothetical protein
MLTAATAANTHIPAASRFMVLSVCMKNPPSR